MPSLSGPPLVSSAFTCATCSFPAGHPTTLAAASGMAMTTGELVHVDGGYHAMGADLPPAD